MQWQKPKVSWGNSGQHLRGAFDHRELHQEEVDRDAFLHNHFPESAQAGIVVGLRLIRWDAA
jgi:hypothetical protein